MAATAVHMACLIATLTDPPGVMMYKEMYFQRFPIARFREGCKNVSEFIQFQLYTELSTSGTNLTLGDVAALAASPFDRRRRTLLYLHGFGESSVGSTTFALRDAFLARGGYNVVVADYLRLVAAPWYATAVNNTAVVGRHVAHFVDFLAAHGGLRMRDLHVIGISLGGQVAAAMGAATRRRVGRITGLDPASPGYESWPPSQRLNRAHARFVDVIHTDSTGFGVDGSVGHADFYPNGGVDTQPWCRQEDITRRNGTLIERVFCSHLQAYMFFLTSLVKDDAFPATPCASWRHFQRGECVGRRDADVFMGIATPKTARGDFYLSTLGVKIANPLTASDSKAVKRSSPKRG